MKISCIFASENTNRTVMYIDELGVQYSDDRKTLISAPKDIRGSHVAYQGVETIKAEAFNLCVYLTSVVVPDSVVTIEHSAFACCASLETVFLPESLKRIESNTFYACGALKYIELPKALESIGEQAFMGCRSLLVLVLPDHVSVIEDRAFAMCSGLRYMILSAELKTLGEMVFAKCSKAYIIVWSGIVSLIDKDSQEEGEDGTVLEVEEKENLGWFINRFTYVAQLILLSTDKNTKAMLEVGDLFRTELLEPDEELAVSFYKKAAMLGDKEGIDACELFNIP